MFAGSYRLRLTVGVKGGREEYAFMAHSPQIKKPPYKNVGYSQQSITPSKDPKVMLAREVKDSQSKYGEFGEAMRPITSRLFAVRDYHDWMAEGDILSLESRKGDEYKHAFRIVEMQHKPELKEIWLFCDRTQNNILVT